MSKDVSNNYAKVHVSIYRYMMKICGHKGEGDKTDLTFL